MRKRYETLMAAIQMELKEHEKIFYSVSNTTCIQLLS